MSDSTSDSTAIIVIDSTDATSITVISDIDATVANSLVTDFAASMGPIAAKCDKLAGQTDAIRDQISAMTPSGTSLLDQLLEKGLNAAYGSSAWAMASEASEAIKNTLAKCEYFQDAADKASKYADPSKFLKSLAGAAVKHGQDAIKKIADSFGGEDNFPELGIGKALNEIAGTGRAIYDKASETLEDAAEAISPVIEYGKTAINAAQNELAAAAKELGKLDKLVNCLAGIGGPDYAPAIDEMIDQLDCYYDKLGVFSDSALPNFGEFDFETYLGSIGAIAGDPQVIDNIKKGVNLYSKAQKNAEGAIAKASDLGLKVPSALQPGSTKKTIVQKQEYVTENSATSQTIPGIPGKTETRTVTKPAPEPVAKPAVAQGDPPDPEPGKVAYVNYVKENEFLIGPGGLDYLDWDPGKAWAGDFLSAAFALVQKISVEEPDTPPTIKMEVEIVAFETVVKNKVDPNNPVKVIFTLYQICAVRVLFKNTVTNTFVFKSGQGQAVTPKWFSKSEVLKGNPTQELKESVARESVLNAINSLSFSQSDVEKTLGW